MSRRVSIRNNLVREAEIGQLDMRILIDQYVMWFDIPVNDGFAVGISQCSRQFDQPNDERSQSLGVWTGMVGPFEMVGERCTGNELRRDEHSFFVLADFVDRDDVWMAQTSRRFGLSQHPLFALFGRRLCSQDFQRGMPVKERIVRAIHVPKAAGTEYLFDFESPDRGPALFCVGWFSSLRHRLPNRTFGRNCRIGQRVALGGHIRWWNRRSCLVFS
nr:hypothetical protein [Stieleria maiorica]